MAGTVRLKGQPGRLSLARVYVTFSPSIRASPVVNRMWWFLWAMFQACTLGGGYG